MRLSSQEWGARITQETSHQVIFTKQRCYKSILLFSMDAFNLLKGILNAFAVLQTNAETFLFITNLEKKMYYSFHKNIKQNLLNIDNNSTKSTYHNDFWRIMWHWRLEYLKGIVHAEILILSLITQRHGTAVNVHQRLARKRRHFWKKALFLFTLCTKSILVAL